MYPLMRSYTFVLSLIMVASLHAGERDVNPGINDSFRHPDFATWVERFEHEGREVYDKRMQIVQALRLKPGMRVADVGAGTGFFSRLFSPQVGNTGKVYAEDISEVFVRNIRRIARQQGMHNIISVLGTDRDARLPRASLDLIFVCDTYHHFEYPQTMLASLRSALKPGGRLVIIDFVKDPASSSDWIMKHVRANKHTVIGELKAAGFRMGREEAFLNANYFIVFKKR